MGRRTAELLLSRRARYRDLYGIDVRALAGGFDERLQVSSPFQTRKQSSAFPITQRQSSPPVQAGHFLIETKMTGSRSSKHDLRRFAADTTALLSFFTLTGIINERWIAGMSWSEVLNARVLGAVLMVPVARPYGLWRDCLLQRARPDRISQFVWDALALMSFQAPIYAAIIFISGAAGRSLLFGVAGAVVMMLVLGRPYGLYLTWVRNRFGVPPEGGR